MFRLVVLSVLVAVAAAAPSYLHDIPVATSHQKRVDVIESSPVLTKIIAPVVHLLSDDHSEDLHDYDDSHIYEEDSHNIHLSSPIEDTIVVVAPETVKTVSSHHEVHQIHDTPVDDVKIIDVVSAPSFDSIAVDVAPEVEDIHHISAPLEIIENESHYETPVLHSLPIVHPVEDIHHVSAPLFSSVKSVESQYEVQQVHDTPIVHSVPSVVAPIVVNHELPQVHHEIPVVYSLSLVKPLETVSSVAVSHTARTDVHKGVLAVPAVHHAW